MHSYPCFKNLIEIIVKQYKKILGKLIDIQHGQEIVIYTRILHWTPSGFHWIHTLTLHVFKYPVSSHLCLGVQSGVFPSCLLAFCMHYLPPHMCDMLWPYHSLIAFILVNRSNYKAPIASLHIPVGKLASIPQI
jgi:hypothetical protein